MYWLYHKQHPERLPPSKRLKKQRNLTRTTQVMAKCDTLGRQIAGGVRCIIFLITVAKYDDASHHDGCHTATQAEIMRHLAHLFASSNLIRNTRWCGNGSRSAPGTLAQSLSDTHNLYAGIAAYILRFKFPQMIPSIESENVQKSSLSSRLDENGIRPHFLSADQRDNTNSSSNNMTIPQLNLDTHERSFKRMFEHSTWFQFSG